MEMNKPIIKRNNLEEKIYLYVVLSQFNLGEHLYKFWLKLDTFSVKPFQLKMHKTYLNKMLFQCNFMYKLDLPENQKDSNGEGRYSEMSCCGSGSL